MEERGWVNGCKERQRVVLSVARLEVVEGIGNRRERTEEVFRDRDRLSFVDVVRFDFGELDFTCDRVFSDNEVVGVFGKGKSSVG